MTAPLALPTCRCAIAAPSADRWRKLIPVAIGRWFSALLSHRFDVGKNGERTVDLEDFIQDAYTTVLAHDELVSEVVVDIPVKGSGGAYLAFKRAAPVYPTASAAVQLTMDGSVCKDVAIALGCVGL